MAETAKGGPFEEILDGESARTEPNRTFPSIPPCPIEPNHRHSSSSATVDIFVNCIYLSKPIPKFITSDFIAQAGDKRRLSVVVDVSCE
jgi:saccharopine dehydrogenase (NAD+, L-lysine-forming)